MIYDRTHWEQLWQKTLREHPDKVARRPPNAQLVSAVAELAPGRALDAGCGHGAESLWLAAHGWQVTGVDFSASALAHARSTTEALGGELSGRLRWTEGDLSTWSPPPDSFDLVACLYVHAATSVEELVQRLASGVAPGGHLFMIGHRPIDPASGKPTAAAGQVQVSVEGARAALSTETWEILLVEERVRVVVGTGVDAVILARRIR
jgi:SAM-dependent methyltransferase